MKVLTYSRRRKRRPRLLVFEGEPTGHMRVEVRVADCSRLEIMIVRHALLPEAVCYLVDSVSSRLGAPKSPESNGVRQRHVETVSPRDKTLRHHML